MISPGNVSAVTRLLPGFDAFFRIARLILPPLTPTMSFYECLKIIVGDQEQPKRISDTFRQISLFYSVGKSLILSEVLIQNASQS
jgi:hypothetical protein